ncbi:hypothetical protein CW740_02520 [Kangiella profundi]|uniref:Uncharacterized protein n=1 Tax=Kangiella profundi TaxID=1561924 RepID=A0A2K9ASM6_9GAMM|nr:hypothetical protein [Kangiella profundi]AUD78171.1 hypothetical protein CW740_02520 [Kangiella profundi]GGF05700.1 hypothetical protein GCM10011356_19090 [Kangiella profundi]
MKKILIVGLILSLAANAYLFFNQNDQSITKVISTPTKQQTNQINNNQVAGAETTLALKAKIKELETTIAEISENRKADKSRIQELEDLLANKDIAQESSKPMRASSKSNTIDKEEVEKLRAEKESLIEQFEEEKVDPSWAYKVQDDITDMIHESDLLLNMSFNGIECKTTKCRVSITPNEQGMGHKITAFFDVSSQLRESEYSKYVTISDNMGDESGEMYVYLSRPDTEE